jgi:hypothetical protein
MKKNINLYKVIDVEPNGIVELHKKNKETSGWEFLCYEKEAWAFLNSHSATIMGRDYKDFEHEGDERIQITYYVGE